MSSVCQYMIHLHYEFKLIFSRFPLR